MKKTTTGLLALSLLAFTAVACGSGDDSTFGENNDLNGGEGAGASEDTSGFGAGGSGGGKTTTKPSSADSGVECAASSAQATLTKKPVDVIFVIDNSGSMSGEIKEVEKQINDNFRTIIENSGIDYRVIMVARHGSAENDQAICVSAPLSSASTCSPLPAKPGENGKFFHYNVQVESHDAWCKLLSTIDKPDTTDGMNLHPTGWGSLLRANALKTFIVMTDDNVSCSTGGKTYNDGDQAADNATKGTAAASAFDAALLAKNPAQFGTADARNYVFHSIVSLAENPAGAKLAYAPTDPIATGKCASGAQSPGTGYQALSILTGGLRFPTCDQGGTFDYSPIFNKVAEGIVSGSSVACEFAVPKPPPGETLDMSTLAVQYRAGGAATPVEFDAVADATKCAPGKFYVNGGATGTIHLCPDTCTAVKSDLKADIRVVSGCARITPPSGGNGGPR